MKHSNGVAEVATFLDPAQEILDVALTCRGCPIVELVGQGGAFLVTDAGELISVGPHATVLASPDAHAPERPARLALASAAALDFDGAPVLATMSARIAWLRSGAWEVHEHGAQVLSLVSTRAGVLAGDSAGVISLLDARRIPGLHAGEPVVELRASGDDVGALGAEGGVWILRWPHDESSALTPIDAGRVGRAFGLFSAPPGKLGAFGARRAAIVDVARGRVVATSLDLGEIRAITCLDGSEGYAVLTDHGEIAALDSSLRSPMSIKLPSTSKPAAAVGVRAAAGGSILAWTSAGELFHVDVRRDGRARRIAGEGVVFAYPTSVTSCVAVRAAPGGLHLCTEIWS